MTLNAKALVFALALTYVIVRDALRGRSFLKATIPDCR